MNPIFSSLKPKVVITAPNGQKLWIDPMTQDGSGTTSSTSLWPNGLSVTLQFGEIPTNSDTDTDSVPGFMSSQVWTLLQAPGPLGLPIGLWLVGAVGGIAAFALRKK